MSADGAKLAFRSNASILVAGSDTNGTSDLFLHDTATGKNTLVSRSYLGETVADNGSSSFVSMSANGRYVLFQSGASDIVAGDTNGVNDLFLFDATDGSIALVTRGLGGEASAAAFNGWGTVTNEGIVNFYANASDLTGNDTNNAYDVYAFDPRKTIDGVAITGEQAIENYLKGTGWADTLTGGAKADIINAGAGKDILTGGQGSDTFVFSTPADGIDTITDFAAHVTGSAQADFLSISAKGFGGGLIAGGSVTVVTTSVPLAFLSGSGDGYFLFDGNGADAGSLYWDATGGSASDAVKIAELTNVNLLQASDFNVVA